MEDLNLKQIEEDSSEKCIVCNWPINRRISLEKSKKFLKGVKEWVRKNSNKKVYDKIKKKLKFLEKEMNICRYDFFQTIKEIIESKNKKLGKKFDAFLKTFDFEGSLVS